MSKLNTEQKQAVEHVDGPIMVVAGAGTGKTHVITQRIASLIKNEHAKPHEILALTFTEKAAEEMAFRVSEILNSFVIDVNVSTFNAFGAELINEYSTELGLGFDAQLLNQKQQIVFFSQHIEHFDLDYYAPITFPHRFVPDLVAFFSKLKNELIEHSDYITYARKLEKSAKSEAEKLEAKKHNELARAYREYARLMHTENVIDFDDQIYLPIQLFRQKANVLAEVQARYKYVLVDEFQDTNRAQAELLELIGGHQNIMVVGDDDQSIYQFRGANVRNILEFQDKFKNARQLSLTQNYRSSQQVLDSAYRLIQHNNPERLEAKYGIDKQLTGQFSDFDPVVQSFSSIEEEADWVASDIARVLDVQPDISVALLLRKNSQSRIMMDYLHQKDIVFEQSGESESVFEQEVVLMLLNFLEALDDASHASALYKVLKSGLYPVDQDVVNAISSRVRREHIPFEQLLRDERDLDDWFKVFDELRHYSQKESIGRLCYLILEKTGLLVEFKQNAENDTELSKTIASLNQFFQLLSQFERVSIDKKLPAFLEEIPILIERGDALKFNQETMAPKEGVVQIMTIHRAKGLEFDHVYLFDMTEQTFPARRQATGLSIPSELLELSDDDIREEHIREERRLMYVAMTRAKKRLNATFSYDHGGKQLKKPSRFLYEAFEYLEPQAGKVNKTTTTSQIDLFADAHVPGSRQERLVLTTGKIVDYLRSPEEYFDRHVLSVPEEPSGALQYGVLIHSAIERYYQLKKQGLVTLSSLVDFVEKQWPKVGFISSDHSDRSLDKAKRAIKYFYEREEGSNLIPNLIEQPFQLEIEEANVVVKGRLDAVYTNESSVEIRDFKTGGNHIIDRDAADKRAKESMQLRIYALAWRAQHGVAPEVMTLDFVDRQLLGQVTFTKRVIDNTEKKIIEVANEIRSRWYS